MSNLMMPSDNLEAVNARDAAERIAALDAATQLGSTTTEALLSDADIILAWIRAGRAVLVSPAPPDAQNPAQGPRTAAEGTEVPSGP